MIESEMQLREAAFRADLEALRIQYMRRLPELAEAFASAWDECRDDAGEEAWLAVRSLAHKMSGSAPCYGLEALGLAARELDGMLSGKAPCRSRRQAGETAERVLSELRTALREA